ncbi:oligosaccharide flippase family protein [Bacillus gobiensis]|uniref:oligosaccharide flippase family protein n=1 Tax=Bacillus gobiensis TaxID=1441095 RepID=UPI003D1DFA33
MRINGLFKNKLVNNIFGLGIFRLLGIISNFLLIGLVYRFLGDNELNGIWLTVFSILTWFTVLDFGMGNSLRNKLTTSIEAKNTDLSNRYINTTYLVMLIPTIVIIIVGFTTAIVIDWTDFFNISNESITSNYLRLFIVTVIFLQAINFYLSLLFALLHATFNSYLISMLQFIVSLVNLLIISCLYWLNISNLIVLGAVYIGSSIIILFSSTIYFFKKNKHDFKFGFKYFDTSLIKEIFNIGMKFLILQLAIIILINTDNFLISLFLGVEKVTQYQLLFKLLSIFTIALGIILTPVWTLIIQYNANNEIKKLKLTILRLIFTFVVLSIFVIVTGLFSNIIITFWIGKNINLNTQLIILMAIFTILHMWSNIFQNILNGMTRLNIQVIAYGLAGIINIPISIVLVNFTDLELSAVILGSIIAFVFPAIILPLYCYRIFFK